ncbi:MAG: hypothetical protein F2754_05915 [Actinobacteria bacterium]|nr:hypothetical protein [Actinomycetota bacterium]MSW91601.1 hypothetical protein [Actinomycetota bacterium]MSX86905.1 hypothetical protein [Actinomycetota bacterium]MSY71489.1 hypothetical protein [Actinomycetota bacterium]
MNAAGKSRPNATRSDRRQAVVRRRREQEYATRRAHATESRRRVRRRRLLAGVGIVVALLLVGGGVALVLHERNKPDLALKASKIASKAKEQKIVSPPLAYHVTYRVQTAGDDNPIYEDVIVRRPFDMRYRLSNDATFAKPLYDLVITKNNRTERNDGVPETAENATPVLLSYGTRFDATLSDLISNGFFVRRERRKLLDTECTVYRTGSFIEAGKVVKATDTQHTDICISDDGLMLEEVNVASGAVSLRVTATEIVREPGLADTDFPVTTDAATLTAGGVQVVDLPRSSVPTTPYWQWAAAPEGWTFSSRQRVEVTKVVSDSTGPAATKVSWVDLYTRGADVLIVRQGAAGAEPVSVDTTNAIDTTVGDLGAAKLVVDTIGNTVVVSDVNGRFIQLFATTSASDLITVAGSLKVTTASG